VEKKLKANFKIILKNNEADMGRSKPLRLIYLTTYMVNSFLIYCITKVFFTLFYSFLKWAQKPIF
jgi:hypothetical protein